MITLVNDIQKLATCQYELIDSDLIAIDVETTGLDPYTDGLLLIQLYAGKDIYVIDYTKFESIVIKGFFESLRDKKYLAHNAKFDLKFIYHTTGILLEVQWDTMVAEALLLAGLHSRGKLNLKLLVEKYCNYTMDKEVRDEFLLVNPEEFNVSQEMLQYGADDVVYLFDIMNQQKELCDKDSLQRTYTLEYMLIPVTMIMEYNGIDIGTERWLRIYEENKKLADELQVEVIEELASEVVDKVKWTTALDFVEILGLKELRNGKWANPLKKTKDELSTITQPEVVREVFKRMFNLKSSNQIKNVLHALGEDVASTDKHALKKVENPVAKKFTEYRELSKQIDSYGVVFLENSLNPVTKRIHPNFNQNATASGRYSSSDPNIQQIPAVDDYRHSFIAPEGKVMITADYSQQELRLLASVIKEPSMIQAFNNGIDLHKYTAAALYGISIDEVEKHQRSRGKAMNFAINYGVSVWGVKRNFEVSLEEAQDILDKYFALYPVLEAFLKLGGDKIVENMYSVTPLGRRRRFERGHQFESRRDADKSFANIRREGINHIIQGGGADIMKMALVVMFYENPFGDKFKIVATIHDEVVVEVDEGIAEEAQKFVEESMKKAGKTLITEVEVIVDSVIAKYWSKE